MQDAASFLKDYFINSSASLRPRANHDIDTTVTQRRRSCLAIGNRYHRSAIKLCGLVSQNTHFSHRKRASLTHLTTNAMPVNTKHTTIMVMLPFFQYGMSVAGYSTMPHQVYRIWPPMFIVYRTTLLTASSPPRWHTALAQPYMMGLTM